MFHPSIDLGYQQRLDNEQAFLLLLGSIENKGKDALLAYLKAHDFARVPSSTSPLHHHCWKGGWLQHALGVYLRMVWNNGHHSHRSIAKVGLLHDLCKLDEFYIDEDGKMGRRVTQDHRHGAKSVAILKNLGYELTPEERRAIRWHMGGHHAHGKEAEDDLKQARHESLYRLVHQSDGEDARDDQHLRAPGTLILREPRIYAPFSLHNKK